MLELHVEIARFVADEQPGWVECRLVDAAGDTHVFVEKVPIVCERPLVRDSVYPQAGVIACTLVERRGDADGELLVVDTATPYGVCSVDEVHRFIVRAHQLGGRSRI